MIPPKITGILLIAIGLLYVFGTKLFLSDGWKKISLMARDMPPEKHKRFLRIWGVVVIIGGCYFLFGDRIHF